MSKKHLSIITILAVFIFLVSSIFYPKSPINDEIVVVNGTVVRTSGYPNKVEVPIDIDFHVVKLKYPKKEFLGNTIKLEISVDKVDPDYGVDYVRVSFKPTEFKFQPDQPLEINPGDSKFFVVTSETIGKKIAIVFVEIIQKDGFSRLEQSTNQILIEIEVIENTLSVSLIGLLQLVSSMIGLPALILLFVTKYVELRMSRKKLMGKKQPYK